MFGRKFREICPLIDAVVVHEGMWLGKEASEAIPDLQFFGGALRVVYRACVGRRDWRTTRDAREARPIGRVLSGLGVVMVGTGGTVVGSAAASTLAPVKAVKARHSQELLDIPGVHRHGIGLSESGRPVIRIFVTGEESGKAKESVPSEIESVPVEVQVTEPLVAF